MELAKVANDWRAIYGAMLIIASVGVWAADTHFQTDNEALQNQIILLEYQKQDLETEKGFAETDREQRKLDSLINNKESQIKQLKARMK